MCLWICGATWRNCNSAGQRLGSEQVAGAKWSGPMGSLSSWFPGNLGSAQPLPGISCKNKKIVAQTVDITQDQRLDEQLFFLEANAGPFGTATDAAGNMRRRHDYVSAG